MSERTIGDEARAPLTLEITMRDRDGGPGLHYTIVVSEEMTDEGEWLSYPTAARLSGGDLHVEGARHAGRPFSGTIEGAFKEALAAIGVDVCRRLIRRRSPRRRG